jgi:hypothetical protein
MLRFLSSGAAGVPVQEWEPGLVCLTSVGVRYEYFAYRVLEYFDGGCGYRRLFCSIPPFQAVSSGDNRRLSPADENLNSVPSNSPHIRLC